MLSLLVVGACGGSKQATHDAAGGSAGADAAGTAGNGGASGGTGSGGGAGSTGGGAAGVGGTGVTGVAGSGAAGVAGSGVAGTSGGTAGASGGTSGATGTAGGAECQTAADCMLASDCCSCRAEPKGTPADGSCPPTCQVDRCMAYGIQPNEVTCVFGRCVLNRSCLSSRITCLADPVACPAGTIHSVVDGCWGPCLPPTECNGVDDCSSCGAGSVCAHNQFLGGPPTGCVTPAPDCSAGSYCACLGACGVVCTEADAGVTCFCPGCF